MPNPISCLDGPNGCEGEVEFRMPLSGTGKSFARCEKHWDERLDKQDEFNRKQRDAMQVDWMDAGERWDEW